MYKLLSLFLLFQLAMSVMHLHLDPSILALIPTNMTADLTPNTVIFPGATDAVGVSSTYNFGTPYPNTTCGPPQLTRLFAPYGTCFKNYIGNQPNCSVVKNCLIYHASTFQEYTECLTPTEFLYTKISPNNDSSYLVSLFIDPDCTTPFIFFMSLSIPFGCQPAQIYNANGDFCGLSQNISPSDNKQPQFVLSWILIGFAIGMLMLVVVFFGIIYIINSIRASKATKNTWRP